MLELFDERADKPVRARIGALLRVAHRADFAVTRIRLGALDLQPGEVKGLHRCRVLLGSFDATTLDPAPDAGGCESRAHRTARLEVLHTFLESGRLEVRSAGLARWVPDFCLFTGSTPTAILGANHFGPPYNSIGPSFTALVKETAAVKLLASRFEEVWRHGHDVLPAVQGVIRHALERHGQVRPGTR